MIQPFDRLRWRSQRALQLNTYEQPSSAQQRLAISIWLGAVAVTILFNINTEFSSFELGTLTFFVVLHLISEITTVRYPAGMTISLANATLMASALAIDTPTAMLIGLLSGAVVLPGRVYFGTRHHRNNRTPTLILETLLATATSVLGVATAGAVFEALGGQVGPESHYNFQLLMAFMVVFFGVKWLLNIQWMRLGDVNIVGYFSHYWQVIFLTDSLAVMATPLVINEMINTRIAPMIISVGLYVIAAYLILQANRSQLRLTDRLNDLSILNSIGQDFSAQLSIQDVVEAIHRHLSPIMDTDGLYISLFDEQEGKFTFPLVYELGTRHDLPPRAPRNGLTEWIFNNNKPLIINRHLERTCESLGITPETSTPIFAKSFIGVPIRQGDKPIGVLALRNYSGSTTFRQDDINLLETIAAQAAIALHNALLFEQAHIHADELRTLNEMAAMVNTSLELNLVIERINAEVIRLTECDRAAVFLAVENGQALRMAGSLGLTENYVWNSQHIPASASRMRAFREGRIMIIEDLRNDRRFRDLEDFTLAEGFHAAIDIPLKSGKDVIGTITAYYDRVRTIDRRTVDLLDGLGKQVSIAVENARRFDALRVRSRQLEALYESSSAINASLSVPNVLRAVCVSILNALESEVCHAWIVDMDQQRLRSTVRITQDAFDSGGPPGSNARFVDFDTQSPLYMALKGQRTIEINSDLPPSLRQLVSTEELNSGLILPIAMYGNLLGVIVTGWKEHLHLIPRERRHTAEALGNQAAVSMENARLFERTDTALNKRLEELAALEAISHRMTRRLDLNAVIEQVVEAAAEATDADLSELMLIEPTHDKMRVAARMYQGEWHDNDTWSPDRGIVGQAIERNEPVLVSDVRTDEFYVPFHKNILSELAVPISLDQRMLGVINLESEQTEAFTTEHARFVTNLAKQAAIAIENARLFETVNHRAEEFRTLRNIAMQLLSATDTRAALHVITEAAMNATHARNIHIYLYDADEDKLTFGTSLWRDGRVDVEFAPPRPNGMTYTVARDGDSIVAMDPHHHPLFAEVIQVQEWQGVTGMISLPLRSGSTVIGVFNISLDRDSIYTSETLRFLDLLSSQAAVAINNARYAEELYNARNRLQALLDSIHDGIIMLDEAGTLVLANPRADYLLNVHMADHIGKPWLSMLAGISAHHHESSVYNRREIVAMLREIKANPYSITRRSYLLETPTTRAVDEISIAVTDRDNKLIGRLFVLRDSTQQYELDQYRQEMSQMIVHDLRSPLGGVITALQLALDEYEVTPASPDLGLIENTLHVALKSSSNLLRLIETMLDVNKLENREIPLRLEQVGLDTILTTVSERLASIASEAGIEVQITVPDDLPELTCDRELIARVINNLLDNALRYTPNGGTVEVHIRQAPGLQEVIVRDNGAGIPVEDRERIFERFYQADQATRHRGSKGSGLGLTFSHLAIEAHGGRIWVTDGIDDGAAFHFTLPTSLTL